MVSTLTANLWAIRSYIPVNSPSYKGQCSPCPKKAILEELPKCSSTDSWLNKLWCVRSTVIYNCKRDGESPFVLLYTALSRILFKGKAERQRKWCKVHHCLVWGRRQGGENRWTDRDRDCLCFKGIRNKPTLKKTKAKKFTYWGGKVQGRWGKERN